MDPKNVGQVLEAHRADFLAQLKPLQDFIAEQKAAAAKPADKPNPLSTLPWQVNLGQSMLKWSEAPKSGQVIEILKDGSVKLLPAGAVMGAGGGLLGVVENPINNLWPALPLGSILVGGLTGVFAGELIDGFVPPKTSTGTVNFMNVGVKGGAIVALAIWGPSLMSRTGTIIAAGLLGIQILVDVLPVGKWMLALINMIRKLFGKPPLTGPPTPAIQAQQQEVNAPAGFTGMQRNDLYAGIFGGN